MDWRVEFKVPNPSTFCKPGCALISNWEGVDLGLQGLGDSLEGRRARDGRAGDGSRTILGGGRTWVCSARLRRRKPQCTQKDGGWLRGHGFFFYAFLFPFCPQGERGFKPTEVLVHPLSIIPFFCVPKWSFACQGIEDACCPTKKKHKKKGDISGSSPSCEHTPGLVIPAATAATARSSILFLFLFFPCE